MTKKPTKTIGRPTSFTPKIGDLICSLIAEGQSLRKITALDNMPRVSTIMNWLGRGVRDEQPYKAFLEQYEIVKAAQAEILADEIIEIADDSSEDRIFIENQNGETRPVINSEFVQRSRLRVDARKWVAAKLLPKKYGDRLEVDTTVRQAPLPEQDKAVLDEYAKAD